MLKHILTKQRRFARRQHDNCMLRDKTNSLLPNSTNVCAMLHSCLDRKRATGPKGYLYVKYRKDDVNVKDAISSGSQIGRWNRPARVNRRGTRLTSSPLPSVETPTPAIASPPSPSSSQLTPQGLSCVQRRTDSSISHSERPPGNLPPSWTCDWLLASCIKMPCNKSA